MPEIYALNILYCRKIAINAREALKIIVFLNIIEFLVTSNKLTFLMLCCISWNKQEVFFTYIYEYSL